MFRLKSFVSMFVSFVLLFLLAFQPTANAEKVEEQVLTILSDTQELMALEVKVDDQKKYSIRIEKKGNSYEWNSEVVDNGQVKKQSNYIMESISKEFSAKKLAENLINLKSSATTKDELEKFYAKHLTFKAATPTNTPTDPSLVFLAIPIAVAGLTEAAILALEATMIVTLAWATYDAVTDRLREKQNTSEITYSAEDTPLYVPSWGDFVAGNMSISLETSANKHMEMAIVNDVHYRIKNYGNETNTQMFTSSVFPSQVMVVVDIKSSLGGIVNRHLGNFVTGARLPRDSAYQNEWMDLSGYSIFLVYDAQKYTIFHAHFTPTRLRDAEIEYNRYLKEYDMKVFPNFSKDSKYLRTSSNWDANRIAARANRGLLRDTKNSISVVPYK